MGSEIDARLARFGPRDVTVLGTNGLLRVLPHAQPLPPVLSMAEVTASIVGAAPASVVQRAEAIIAEEPARKALWLTTGLDAGDGIITVFSSIRSAIALYMGRHGGKQAPVGWAAHQAGDAVLKAIALGYLLDLCFPGSEDPVLDLARLPAGRALLAYFAAAEVALPFVEVMVDGEHALSTLLPEHADSQARKLATIVGAQSVQAARNHLPSIAPTADALVACSADYLAPFAKSAEGTIPGAGRVVNTVGDVVAAGADVLPVYRFLGLRVVAEAAAWKAAHEYGLSVPETGADWVAKYVDAPRRAALPLPASITATGWETIDDPGEELVPTEQIPLPGGAPSAATPAGSAPAASAPAPPSADVPVMAAAAVGAAAVGASAAASSRVPPPANPPAPATASPTAGPPPLPVAHREVAAPAPPPPSASPAVPPPLPVPASAPGASPPPLPGMPPPQTPAAAPPPLPTAATPAAPSAGQVPPPLPAARQAAPVPPALRPQPAPAGSALPPPIAAPPVAPSPQAAAPPVSSAAAVPPKPTPPAPPRAAPAVAAPPQGTTPPRVAAPPKKAAAPPKLAAATPSAAVAPPPKASKAAAPTPSAPKVAPPPSGRSGPSGSSQSSGPPPSGTGGGGFSFTAIGITIAVLLLLGCAGVAGLGGMGALFVGAHNETTDEAPKPTPKKGTRKGSKKSSSKGSKKSGSQKSGGKTSGGKSSGTKSKQKAGKSKRTGSRRRR